MQLRSCIVQAHSMATADYLQSDTEMRKRIGSILEKVIDSDLIMRGFLGRGGQLEHRDRLSGSGSLDDLSEAEERKRFEAWISSAPFEKGITQQPNDAYWYAFPSTYLALAVDVAWQAWKEAKGIE
jgi:hypothetical protein